MDRISELPDVIIHKIMSHLSPYEVAQASILSKRWNYLRTSFPILEFNRSYPTRNQILSPTQSLCLLPGIHFFHIEKFMKVVDVSLRRFCRLEYSMEKFRLSLWDPNVIELSSRFDEWIWLTVEKDVKELDIRIASKFYTWPSSSMYTLPRTIFSAKFLTTLKLSDCKIEQSNDSLMLCSLKSLTLKGVCINEQMLQKFTSECPSLEDLSISNCWVLKHLCVAKGPKLKFIEILCSYDHESIEIAVPFLQWFRLELCYEQTPSIDLAGCPYLNKLELFKVNSTEQFHHLISKLPWLEDLYMSKCKFLERVRISNDRLKKLEIHDCPRLKAIHFDTPNLLSFSYHGDPIPTIASTTAPCPLKVRFHPGCKIDTHWFMNLKEFLEVANQIEALKIFIYENKISFNLDGLREGFASFRCQVKILKLTVGKLSSDYRALLDGLLWSCCPRILYLTAFGENQQKFLQWLYEELRNRCVNCCNSHTIKCWRHYLKDVKILSTLQMEDWRSKNWKLLNIDDDDLHDVWPINQEVTMLFDLDWVL